MVDGSSGARQDNALPDEGESHVKREMDTASHRIICARCGTAFNCGGDSGDCWCMDEAYRLPMPTAAREDCVCPACLRQAALSRPIGTSA
jgi:hypothetical protein